MGLAKGLHGAPERLATILKIGELIERRAGWRQQHNIAFGVVARLPCRVMGGRDGGIQGSR
jgi:hypothetical protein